MGLNVSNSQVPHEKFLDSVKNKDTNPKTEEPKKGDPPVKNKTNLDIGKDVMVDGGNPLTRKTQKQVKSITSEVTGSLFPVDGVKLAKSILKETDPKKQLNLLMNFTKELDKMNSEQLSEIKGYLTAKKEESNDPEKSILKKLSFSNDDILDSMLSAVDKEIASRKPFRPIIGIDSDRIKLD